MIFYIIRAEIKEGQFEAFTAANEQLMAFITENEPAYASYSFVTDDQRAVTWVNVFDDAAAMATHQQLIADRGLLDDLMPTFVPTSREVYGDLTPDLVDKVAGAAGIFTGAAAGTFDRHVRSESQ